MSEKKVSGAAKKPAAAVDVVDKVDGVDAAQAAAPTPPVIEGSKSKISEQAKAAEPTHAVITVKDGDGPQDTVHLSHKMTNLVVAVGKAVVVAKPYIDAIEGVLAKRIKVHGTGTLAEAQALLEMQSAE